MFGVLGVGGCMRGAKSGAICGWPEWEASQGTEERLAGFHGSCTQPEAGKRKITNNVMKTVLRRVHQ